MNETSVNDAEVAVGRIIGEVNDTVSTRVSDSRVSDSKVVNFLE